MKTPSDRGLWPAFPSRGRGQPTEDEQATTDERIANRLIRYGGKVNELGSAFVPQEFESPVAPPVTHVEPMERELPR